MGGPFALDLMPMFHALDRMGLEPNEYDELLEDVQVMAAVALAAMAEGRQ